MPDQTTDKLRLELRRGAIVLAVLAQLRKEQYGYSLRQELLAAGISVDEGTLYPLIRRLEQQGLLDSEWRVEERRRKRFYRLSEQGQDTLRTLREEWQHLSCALNVQ
ncbi:MAG: PadR family transcriptional regulator, partial [Pseudomonadales bacterium]